VKGNCWQFKDEKETDNSCVFDNKIGVVGGCGYGCQWWFSFSMVEEVTGLFGSTVFRWWLFHQR